MIFVFIIASAVIGYILGAIPFGLFMARWFGGKDLREVGSGKVGTTNVMRAAGKKAAALALLLDLGKCAAAATIAKEIFSTDYALSHSIYGWGDAAMVLAALCAMVGHTWSVFLKFKGGRGVATFIGGLTAMFWPAAAIGGGLMILIGIRTKYMSLGSIIGAVAAFIALMTFNFLGIYVFGSIPPFVFVLYAMLGAIFIYIMHRDNIIRLFKGTERRIGEKVQVETSPSTSIK